MKTAILVLISLLSVQSFAANVCSKTWEQIDSDRRLQTEMPKIQFGTIFVSVDSLCVAEDTLQTKEAVAVCTKWGRGELGECIAETSQILSTPIVYSKEISKGDTGFETITQKHALVYSIPVGYSSEAGLNVLCKKTLTLPVCQ